MNKQKMMQLMAQRLNLTPDDTRRIESGDFYSVAAARFASDPMMLSMVNMMQDQAREQHQADVDEDLPPPRRAPRVLDDAAELQEALSSANTMLRYLAQLFGACRCWGKNPRCPRCDGDGAPGYHATSDPNAYLAWVTPQLRHLGYAIVPLTDSSPVTISRPVLRRNEE